MIPTIGAETEHWERLGTRAGSDSHLGWDPKENGQDDLEGQGSRAHAETTLEMGEEDLGLAQSLGSSLLGGDLALDFPGTQRAPSSISAESPISLVRPDCIITPFMIGAGMTTLPDSLRVLFCVVCSCKCSSLHRSHQVAIQLLLPRQCLRGPTVARRLYILVLLHARQQADRAAQDRATPMPQLQLQTQPGSVHLCSCAHLRFDYQPSRNSLTTC